jgi:hypothetical protein
LQGLPFKHLTHKSRLTTINAYCSRLPPRALLPDHLLLFRGWLSSCSTPHTVLLQHFQIGTAHAGLSVPLPDILVAAQRGYPGNLTRVSERLRQLFFSEHWAPLAVLVRAPGLCLYPSIQRSFEHSQLSNSERRSFTPHHYPQPYHYYRSASSCSSSPLCPSLRLAFQLRSCYRPADHFTPPTTPLPTLAPPLQTPPKPASWPTTRLRQSRPWGIGHSNHPLVCSSKAGWVGWTMTVGRGKTLQVTRTSKARSFHHRLHIPW